MIISKEFYDACCPSYKKVIDELEQKIAEIEAQKKESSDTSTDDEDEIDVFAQQEQSTILEFAERYLLPKEYWERCISLIFHINWDISDDDHTKQQYEIADKAFQHFCYDKETISAYIHSPGSDGDMYLKLIDFQEKDLVDDNTYAYSVDKMDLTFPHNCLKECFPLIESRTSSPFSKNFVKKYEEMIELYPKIVSAENDVEKWFKLLLEVEDAEFVQHNVEHRLGKNLLDVKLWKLYIEYLKESDDDWLLLEVLSKYCRFFLDDLEMFLVYLKNTAKYGTIDLFWTNLFGFEAPNLSGEIDGSEDDFDMEKAANKSDRDEQTDEDGESTSDEDINATTDKPLQCGTSNTVVSPLDKSLFATFYDAYQIQNFSFKKPLIFYILKNANHLVLRKLFKSCKFFFAKRSTPICYRLENCIKSKFNKENLKLLNSADSELFLKNTYVTMSIDIRLSCNGTTDYHFISTIIPRLSQCDAKYIYLICQKLTFDELKFLIQNGHVVYLEIGSGEIRDEKKEFVDLEKIMQYLPNVEKLDLPMVKCNSNTAHALNALKHYKKFHSFNVKFFGEPFDPDEFRKYITENRDDKVLMRLYFGQQFSRAFVEKFKEIMEDYKKSCENTFIVSKYANF